MIIEDVPIESVKNLNQNLRDQDRSSLTYYNFNLVGLMKEVSLEVVPAFQTFPEPLMVNQRYQYFFKSDANSRSKTTRRPM